MVRAKSKQSVGLGNTLMNDRFGKGKGADRKTAGAGVTRTNHATGEEYITNNRKEAGWVKMRSVTQQSAMDEFLSTAELAGTDFTAEKTNNVKIIHVDQKNPYLLSATEEKNTLNKHKAHKDRLTVPRRPKWDENTTPEQLDALERDSFLNWRRGLADLTENNDLLMTPFERNLEVWRQLWRVIERSHLVVQIVDARNPLMFRSEDLEAYVKDVDPKKKNLLLVNKADMMTMAQRKVWAQYFEQENVAYSFFSASLAKEYLDDVQDHEKQHKHDSEEQYGVAEELGYESEEKSKDYSDEHEGSPEKEARPAQTLKRDERRRIREAERDRESAENTRILRIDELEEVFLSYAPEPNPDCPTEKFQIGLVGYPNVGKSSTINALLGAKKVSVSATPGKTKHFQTIHLSDEVLLCDCPGLVFPNFATTNAELVCNGILPIDQLREFSGPATIVAKQIPQPFLEAIYGIHIATRPLEEGGNGIPTGSELLRAHAKARGFKTSGVGQPDEARSARILLKDYVKGKLPYCEPPPGYPDPARFNSDLYDLEYLSTERRLALGKAVNAHFVLPDDKLVPEEDKSVSSEVPVQPSGSKGKMLDKAFFNADRGNAGHLQRPFNYKYTEQGQAEMATTKPLSGRKARTMVALETGLDPKDVRLGSGKKHFKGGARSRTKKKGPTDDD